MIIQFTLKNDRTGKLELANVYDSTSPSTGYTQDYAERFGRDYADIRAKEVLNKPTHPYDTWTLVSANYVRL